MAYEVDTRMQSIMLPGIILTYYTCEGIFDKLNLHFCRETSCEPPCGGVSRPFKKDCCFLRSDWECLLRMLWGLIDIGPPFISQDAFFSRNKNSRLLSLTRT